MNSFFNFNDFQKQVYRLIFLKVDMKNGIIFGIIGSVIVIGVLVFLSFDSFSMMGNNGASSEPILGDEGNDMKNNQKPLGRNLSIELDEKMGLSAP